jgi:hypothetical protein
MQVRDALDAQRQRTISLTIASGPGQPHATAARPASVYGEVGNLAVFHLGANLCQIHLSCSDTLIRSSRVRLSLHLKC